jgi:hypothetical protein
VLLNHPEVNGGADAGFVLDKESRLRAEGILITRQFVTEVGISLYIYMDVLLADDLINPDGSQHSENRSTMYAWLVEYMNQTSGINITTALGTYLDFGAVGHIAHEYHRPGSSVVKCCWCNTGSYFPPVDPALLTLSIWDGTLTWETSYWR